MFEQDLKSSLTAMAVLDVIMQDEEDSWLRLINGYRLEPGCKFVIDNGSGDRMMIGITETGEFIKGFDHENELNQFAADEWSTAFFDAVYANVPEPFLALIEDEEEREEVTFCMWRGHGEDDWHENADEANDGGKSYLLGYIKETAEDWCEWAEDYYEMPMSEAVAGAVYRGDAVTADMVTALNPERDAPAALKEINELLGNPIQA